MLAGRETEETINQWCLNTFGAAGSDASVAQRAADEMIELNDKIITGAPLFDVLLEAADVIIVLNRLFMRNGCSMSAFVDYKMRVNRNRVWDVKEGHGQHVPQPGDADFRVKESSLVDRSVAPR